MAWVAPVKDRSLVLDELPRGGVGAEIGVWHGDFAEELIEHVRPSRLYLVDPWEIQDDYVDRWYGHTPEERPDAEDVFKRVCLRFEGETRTIIHRLRMTSDEFFRMGIKLDWVYIDGDHTYDQVKRDLMGALEVVKPGGTIAGDDYYVSDAAWGDGVVRAVDQFTTYAANRLGFALSLITKSRQFVIHLGEKED